MKIYDYNIIWNKYQKMPLTMWNTYFTPVISVKGPRGPDIEPVVKNKLFGDIVDPGEITCYKQRYYAIVLNICSSFEREHEKSLQQTPKQTHRTIKKEFWKAKANMLMSSHIAGKKTVLVLFNNMGNGKVIKAAYSSICLIRSFILEHYTFSHNGILVKICSCFDWGLVLVFFCLCWCWEMFGISMDLWKWIHKFQPSFLL